MSHQIATLPQKLARLLLEQSELGTKSIVNFSLEDLANQVGAYRETVGANLLNFRRRQWIDMRRGEVTVVNPAPLLALQTCANGNGVPPLIWTKQPL